MVPKMLMQIINMGPHPLQMQALVHVVTINGETMWIYPDLVEGEHCTTVISKKKIRMEKNVGYHVISLCIWEYNTSASLLTNSKDEQIVLIANPIKETRSGKAHLKNKM